MPLLCKTVKKGTFESSTNGNPPPHSLWAVIWLHRSTSADRAGYLSLHKAVNPSPVSENGLRDLSTGTMMSNQGNVWQSSFSSSTGCRETSQQLDSFEAVSYCFSEKKMCTPSQGPILQSLFALFSADISIPRQPQCRHSQFTFLVWVGHFSACQPLLQSNQVYANSRTFLSRISLLALIFWCNSEMLTVHIWCQFQICWGSSWTIVVCSIVPAVDTAEPIKVEKLYITSKKLLWGMVVLRCRPGHYLCGTVKASTI